MEVFFSYLKGGAAVSAAPTKLLNTFYLIGALPALASGKAERRKVHPLWVNVTNWLVHFLLWQAAKPSGDKCTPLCYLKLFGF